MGALETILTVRRARSLVRSAAMLALGGSSTQRALSQAGVEAAQLALQQQVTLADGAMQAARAGMRAACMAALADGGALSIALRGVSASQPIYVEVTALRRLVSENAPHPAVVQLRLERLAAAMSATTPGVAQPLGAAIRAVREAESLMREAALQRRRIADLWAELRAVMAALAET